MRKYIFVLLLLMCCIMHFARAQDSNKKLHLQSISSIGLLNGSKNSSLALQTIIGGSMKHSFLGVGVGLDYYRFRTIPVFADVRHEFGRGKTNMFLYGDIGYNYGWLTEKNKEDAGIYYENTNYKGGLYYDMGIGCKVGFKNSNAFLLSAGYTFKRVENKAGSDVCPLTGPCYGGIETYRYYLSRIIIKAGWRF